MGSGTSRRVAIIGGGEIGGFIAERLSEEQFDVLVLDRDPRVLAGLSDRLDVASELGNATSLADLRAARVHEVEVLIAATHRDETNLVCCLLAEQLGVPHKIAITRRMRQGDEVHRYLADQVQIDLLLNVNEVVRDEILDVIEAQGASEVGRFADGQVVLMGVAVRRGSALIGTTAAALTRSEDLLLGEGASMRLSNGVGTSGAEEQTGTTVDGAERADALRVAALVREGALFAANGETKLQEGDYFYAFSTPAALETLREVNEAGPFSRRAVVCGGGFLVRLVVNELLARWYRVTWIVDDPASLPRALGAVESLPGLTWHVGEPTRVALQRQLVRGADVFISACARDETNLMACMLARALGVEQTVALIQRGELAALALEIGIRAHVSPRLATAKSLQRAIHGSRLRDYKAMVHSHLDAIELEVKERSRAVGKTLVQLKAPPKTVFGAVVSDRTVHLPGEHLRLRCGDRLVALTDPAHLLELQGLFA